MRAVIQRVSRAEVGVDSNVVASIGRGIVVMLGVAHDDSEADVEYTVKKLSEIRLFSDEEDRLNLSLRQVGGEILLVSNFTVLGNTRKGSRPSYSKAARLKKAEQLYLKVLESLKDEGLPAYGGRFGARMKISLDADGPVTLIIDSRDRRKPVFADSV